MNERTIRIVGWILPSLSMAAAAFLFISQAAQLRAASQEREKASTLLDQAMANRTAALAAEQNKLVAVVQQSPAEETAFLSDLRKRVAESGAKILKWSSVSRPAGEPNKDDSEIDPVLKDVTAIQSELTLGGSFHNLWTLLQHLDKADRLFTLSNITWNRSKESGSVLTCTLTRYTRPSISDSSLPSKL